MTLLQNSKEAIVDIRKLEEYCLNPLHQIGKQKAKVFKSALGFSKNDARILQLKLLKAALNLDAVEISADSFGTRYYIDSEIIHKNKKAVIRSIWIVKVKEKIPRLITCYVK